MARHAFWIIVDGETPTAFRSKQRDDLLPTLAQLQRTQPQMALKWFERGRLWDSPGEARTALATQRQRPRERRQDWRPGGDHVDPRAKFDVSREQKRARFKARQRRDWEKGRDETPEAGGKPPESFRPQGDRPFRPQGDRPFRPKGDRPFRPQGDRPFRPKGDRPFRPQGDRPFRPKGDRPFRPQGDRPFRPKGDRPFRPQGDRPFRPKGDRPFRPKGDRPFRPKGDRPWRPRKPKRDSGED